MVHVLSYQRTTATSYLVSDLSVSKMAEDTSGGKESTTLYCRSFPYGSGVIGSLYLSKDGQLCMLTGSGVHILVSFSLLAWDCQVLSTK